MRIQAEEDAEDSLKKGGGASGGVSYSDSTFPDSTKGTAVVNPPDMASNNVLHFTPSMDFEFPDLTTREFLQPSLRAGDEGSGNTERDTYKRIEERLAAYSKSAKRTGLDPNQIKRGLKYSTGLSPSSSSFRSLTHDTTGLKPGMLGLTLP